MNKTNIPAEKKRDKTITKDDLTDSINAALDARDDKSLKDLITSIHYADLADYINFASYEQRAKIVKVIDYRIDPEILLEFEVDVLRSLRKILGRKRFFNLVKALDVTDTLSLIEDLEEEEKHDIITNSPAEKRRQIVKGLSYPKNSAGIMMIRDYVIVGQNKTVGQVLGYLTGNKDLPDDYDEIFIIDSNERPVGSVHISKLIRHKKTEKVHSIMNHDLKVIDVSLDQEEVAYMFKHYDLTSAPVVDKRKKMVGVIYTDQIVEIIEEEAEEDIMKLGGINVSDLYSAFFKTATQRFPWLFFNLLTACLTSLIISSFRDQVEQKIILAAIMTIVASMGGNAGTQSVTVSVRAIANKDITTSNITHVVLKEVAAGALNGLMLGLLGGAILFLLYGDIAVCAVFALSVTLNFILAGFWGAVIPITIDKIGLDPAISSGVFLTFLTDFLGFFVFLGLASLLIL
ncbi:MAG: magnesium transporter [Alphaproteobacteria bacterium]|nr:magnesium transporter [Alphaproteobacteria bacterium]